MSLRLPGRLGSLQDAAHQTNAHPSPVTIPATLDGGLGRVPASRIDTTKDVPAPRPLNPREAQHLMQAELLSAMRSIVETSTELTARLGRRGSVNGVLEVWAGTIPAGGMLQRSYEVTAGSIYVVNHSAAATITVQTGVPAGDTGAQTAGTGVQYVAPGQAHRMALADRSVTISGVAGDKVSLQVFTGLHAFGASLA